MVAIAYHETPPPVALSLWVACCWTAYGSSTQVLRHRVLPDGCSDLIFELAPVRGDALVRCVGPMRRAIQAEFSGFVDLFGIRLRPGALPALLGVSAQELRDQAIELQLIDRALQRWLDPSTLVALPRAQRAPWLWARLGQRLLATPVDPAIRQAFRQLGMLDAEPASVAILARDLGLSERTLERRFVHATGLNPVVFRRLSRFRQLLRLAAGSELDWASLAAAAGYADQAHLSREFRDFAGITPATWRAEQTVGIVQDGAVECL